jgi:hypothetical protein
VSVSLSEMLVTAYETKSVNIYYTIPLIPTMCLAKFGHVDLISVKYCVRLFLYFKQSFVFSKMNYTIFLKQINITFFKH